MTRQAEIVIHLGAIVALVVAIVWLAANNGHSIDVLLGALFGFAAGLLVDRIVLRPAVDLSNALRRS